MPHFTPSFSPYHTLVVLVACGFTLLIRLSLKSGCGICTRMLSSKQNWSLHTAQEMGPSVPI